MRISFEARETGFESDDFAIICGVHRGAEYLTFQRDAENSGEDWGVYLEYCDQSNSGYSCIRSCRLSPESLSVELSRQLGNLTEVDGFDVVLRIKPEEHARLREWLQRVFRGQAELLELLQRENP